MNVQLVLQSFREIRFSLGIALIATGLGGCAVSELIRETQENAVQRVEAAFFARREATTRTLAERSPCCDTLQHARVTLTLASENPRTTSVGSWPNVNAIEIDGYRSYYVLVSLDASSNDGRRLRIVSAPTALGYREQKTDTFVREVFVPVITFLDVNRNRLGTVADQSTTTPSAVGALSIFPIPKSASFAVIHTSEAVLNRPKTMVFAPGSTVAFPSPFGSGALVIRSQSSQVGFLPSHSGTITVSIE